MPNSSLKYMVFENEPEPESESQPRIFDYYSTKPDDIEIENEVSMKRKMELWKQLKYKDGVVYYRNSGKIYDGNEIKKIVCKEGIYRYHGYLINGKLNGKGMHYYKNKDIKYMGDLVDGMAHGYGVKYSKQGFIEYKGEFRNNYFHGFGRKYDNFGIKYEGNFDSGDFEGYGKLYHQVGTLAYKGDFENGKCNGQGEYYDVKGNMKYKGEFCDNMFHGYGEYYDGNNVLEGLFRNDTFNGRKFYKKKLHFWCIFS